MNGPPDGRTERFIPACAGNSPARDPPNRGPAVHPRVCGELALSYLGSQGTIGSSPRVRGTQLRRSPRPDERRFIPACAGNSPRPALAIARPSVHPRVCGELAIGGDGGGDYRGASPRVRGTRSEGFARDPPRPVHPRVCGELAVTSRSSGVNIGSSPRVRGTHHRQSDHALRFRFIPACAGNSSTGPL